MTYRSAWYLRCCYCKCQLTDQWWNADVYGNFHARVRNCGCYLMFCKRIDLPRPDVSWRCGFSLQYVAAEPPVWMVGRSVANATWDCWSPDGLYCNNPRINERTCQSDASICTMNRKQRGEHSWWTLAVCPSSLGSYCRFWRCVVWWLLAFSTDFRLFRNVDESFIAS